MRRFRCALILAALATAAPAGATVVFQTGFEANEGFNLGFLGSQGSTGWLVITGTPQPAFPIVSNANPAAGTQHLRIGYQPNLPLSAQKGGFTPQFIGIPAGTPMSVSLDINISNTDGAEYGVALQSISQGLLTAFVDFSFTDNDGDLVSGDILLQQGALFPPTGAEFSPGVYKTLRIDFDPAGGNRALVYTYGGVEIGAQPLWSGTAIDQIVVVSDNYQFDNEFGDFDNLIVSTPTTNPCDGVLNGDGNCDNRVDNFDIDPFVFAVVNFADQIAPPGYLGTQQCWEKRGCWADIDRDGLSNNFDIEPFVACVINLPATGQPCPAP